MLGSFRHFLNAFLFHSLPKIVCAPSFIEIDRYTCVSKALNTI